MRQYPSPYYPPRAGAGSRLLQTLDALLRRLPVDRLRPPSGWNLRELLQALIVPGHVFLTLKQARRGQIVLGMYAGLLLVALIWIGSRPANLAFGLMVVLHAISWARLFEVWWSAQTARQRMLGGLCAALLLLILFYLPVQQLVQRHWLLPLRLENRTILTTPVPRQSLRPGQTVVVRVAAQNAPGLRVLDGYVVAEILGEPGDRIRFRSGFYQVNQRLDPALPHMPADGEWMVPENHWFIWPFSSIGIRGNLDAVDPAVAGPAVQRLASVPMANVVGRPLRWWFWRKVEIP
jgi:hypothetical protein